MISPRHMRLALSLLLPLMALRALLPAGYMPVTENGALRIALCSDGLYSTPDKVDTQTDSGNHELPTTAGDCAFANAVPGAAPPAALFSLLTIDTDAGAIMAHAAPTRAVSLVRVQSARGPPSLSL